MSSTSKKTKLESESGRAMNNVRRWMAIRPIDVAGTELNTGSGPAG
jgi:hypothetical protein